MGDQTELIQKLKAALVELEDENDILHESNERMKSIIKSLRDKLAQAIEEKTDFQDQLETLQETHENTKDELAAEKKENEELDSTLQVLEKQNNIFKNQNEELEKTIQSMKIQHHYEVQKLKDLKFEETRSVEEEKNMLSLRVQSLETTLRTVMLQGEETKRVIFDLENEILEVRGNNEQLMNKIAENERIASEAIASKQQQLDERDKKVKELEDALYEAQRKAYGLEQTLKDERSAKLMEERRVIEAKDTKEITELQSKKVERELNRVKGQLEESDAKCLEYQRKIRELERELKRKAFG